MLELDVASLTGNLTPAVGLKNPDNLSAVHVYKYTLDVCQFENKIGTLAEHGGQPTGKKLPDRRESIYVVPVPAARRRGPQQGELALEDKVTTNVLVNEIRKHVDQWRDLPPGQWGVTPETQRLLLHWRDADRERKLFFCQREAVETLIWLTEVAPKAFRDEIEAANAEANPGLYRLGLQDGDRRRQDHGDGDDHRLARGQPGAASQARGTSPTHFSSSRRASRSRTACACSSRRTRRTSISSSISCRAT